MFKGIAILNDNFMDNSLKTDEKPFYLPKLACETHHKLPQRLRGQHISEKGVFQVYGFVISRNHPKLGFYGEPRRLCFRAEPNFQLWVHLENCV